MHGFIVLLSALFKKVQAFLFGAHQMRSFSGLSFGAHQVRSFELYSIRLYSKPYHFDCDIYLTRVF